MIPQLANMARGRHSHQTVLAALQLLPSQEFAAWPRFFRNRERLVSGDTTRPNMYIWHVDVFLRDMYDMYHVCILHMYNIHDAEHEKIKKRI